eukprot:5518283-Heterocapsa_arctica.AAC.1
MAPLAPQQSALQALHHVVAQTRNSAPSVAEKFRVECAHSPSETRRKTAEFSAVRASAGVAARGSSGGGVPDRQSTSVGSDAP